MPKPCIYQYHAYQNHAFTPKSPQTHFPKPCIYHTINQICPNIPKPCIYQICPNIPKPCIYYTINQTCPIFISQTKSVQFFKNTEIYQNLSKKKIACNSNLHKLHVQPFPIYKMPLHSKKQNMSNIRNFNASILVFSFSALTP
jgi:hypothetical protein